MTGTNTQRPWDIWELLWSILDQEYDDAVAYVYRLGPDENPIRPYLLKCAASPDLPETLRDDYGGGDFQVMIRRRRKMIFSGTISIGIPLAAARRHALPKP